MLWALCIALSLSVAYSARMVPTTIGMRPDDCVHTSLEDNVILTPRENGVEAFYPKSGRRFFHEKKQHCVDNANSLMAIQRQKQETVNAPVPLNVDETGEPADPGTGNDGLTQWQDYAYWSTDGIMGDFSGHYSVPADPAENGGQLLYFFIGMQNNGQNPVTIIQPVASYCDIEGGCGAGQGNTLPKGWSMMATNCCPAGQTWYGPTKPLMAGAQIDTVCASNTSDVYVHMMSDGVVSNLNVRDSSRQFNWAAVTLEQYYATACPDYDAQAFNFTQLVLVDEKGTTETPNWRTTAPNNGCGASVTVADNGATVRIQGTDK